MPAHSEIHARVLVQYSESGGAELHLRANFTAMLSQIELHRTKLTDAGVPPARIDGFARSLDHRLAWTGGHVMRWAAFVCRA